MKALIIAGLALFIGWLFREPDVGWLTALSIMFTYAFTDITDRSWPKLLA